MSQESSSFCDSGRKPRGFGSCTRGRGGDACNPSTTGICDEGCSSLGKCRREVGRETDVQHIVGKYGIPEGGRSIGVVYVRVKLSHHLTI
jgi:hypothetical protein